MTEFVIVTTTVADAGAAEAIARTAVERRLAACAGIVARRSVYRWKGALEMADELAVELKTLASVAPALEAAIRELPLRTAGGRGHADRRRLGGLSGVGAGGCRRGVTTSASPSSHACVRGVTGW